VKWRLVAALLGLTLVVLVVHDIPLVGYLRTVENDRIVTALERDSFVIAGRSEEVLESDTATTSTYLQDAIVAYSAASGARVLVTDNAGIVIATSDAADTIGTSFASRPEIASALTGKVNSGRRFSATLNHEILYVAVPVINGNRTIGTVRLTFPASVVDDAVSARVKGISTVAGITLLVAAIVALLLAVGITRRLTKLRDVTEEFSNGNFTVRAQIDGGAPEIQSLARSFNKMADQLEKLISQQRAFAGDASHQLRTPLTALTLRLERVSELLAQDPTAAAERLDAAMVETDRLQRLVEGLLVLSRSEAKGVATTRQDASAIARERAENWDALAAEQNVAIAISIPDSAFVLATVGAIEQVIDNYVDNALEVVPAGSTITILIKADSDLTQISVLDEGPGLSEADLAKAFNRFWRARSDTHGSGLGLAIVERLAEASGGHAELRNRQPNGLEASAYFPTA
jgi:signal transduction histidine kinase